jgi:hypothetical protein
VGYQVGTVRDQSGTIMHEETKTGSDQGLGSHSSSNPAK